MRLETINCAYEVVNFKRKDGLYNVYVKRVSKLTGVFRGEATYCIGSKEKQDLTIEDVINLSYSIN